jgi:5-formyltetrahydrofolate cyclo-ligase
MAEHQELRARLRLKMARQRLALTGPAVERCSKLVAEKLAQLLPVQKANSIMGYMSIRNEIDLRWFMDSQPGKRFLLPRVENAVDLSAVPIHEQRLTRPGPFNIAEPVGEAADPSEIDVVLVPGLVFDGHGYRLGYGKGFYDRFLKQLNPETFICGICYDFQVVDDVHPHPGDVPMHWIVTEQSEVVVNWDFF